MTNKTINSYDIIGMEVQKYRDNLIKQGLLVDNDYIVIFKQSYNPYKDFERCCEIVSINSDNELTFWSDFCEGQQYVVDIKIKALYEVGELIAKECIYK